MCGVPGLRLEWYRTPGQGFRVVLLYRSSEELAKARRRADAILLRAEQSLTRPEGLPGRPWFRHFVYAPGFYTGYGVKTLPVVREAIEQRQWDQVDAGVAATAAVLEAFAGQVEKASAALAGGAE